MNARRWMKSVLAGLLILTVLAACAPAASTPAAGAKVTRSVALILPGAIGDQGWNTKAYLALQEYEKQGFKTAYVDNVPDVDNESHLRSYGEQGFDLIIGHGFTFVDPVMKVAPDFPKSHYFVTAGLPPEGDIPTNIGFMQYKAEQGCYLAGMLAGMMTKSNVIGYVGAQPTPICLADLAAYKLGAREVNPNVKVMVVWTGDWADPAKGKEAALTMIDNGADVLIHDADLAGTGALQAGKERNVYLIGMADDQSSIAPDLFLTSVILNVTKGIAEQMTLIENGTFGGVWKPGLAEGVIDIAPLGPTVPDDVAKKIMTRRQEIIEGQFEVPAIYKEIE